MPFQSPLVKQVLIRVERDQKILDQLEEKLEQCIKEVKALIEKIRK
jgi:DNA-directed RNA polymerase subunit L